MSTKQTVSTLMLCHFNFATKSPVPLVKVVLFCRQNSSVLLPKVALQCVRLSCFVSKRQLLLTKLCSVDKALEFKL